MSVDLYTVRVWVTPTRSTVKVGRVHRATSEPPAIPGLPPHEELDYAPATKTWLIRPTFEGQREMRDDEREAVAAWLREVEQGRA